MISRIIYIILALLILAVLVFVLINLGGKPLNKIEDTSKKVTVILQNVQ